MTIDDQIKDEKLQYDINREAAKLSALSSGKIFKYEYLTSEEILTSNQRQILEQAKFTYYPLGKAFVKQTKTTEDQGGKQVDALKDLKLKELKDKEIKAIKDNKKQQMKSDEKLLAERKFLMKSQEKEKVKYIVLLKK